MHNRVAASAAALALSTCTAFGQSTQIAAISGRDELALYDLASGAELTRFKAPEGRVT